MVVPSIAGIISSLIAPMICKKIGKRNTLIAGLVVDGIALLMVYFTPYDNVSMILIAHFIYGMGGFAAPIMLSMVADSVDYYDLKKGVRTDGTAYATYGLASKLGNAIGGAAGVLLLASFGYVANQQQTPQAQSGINIVVNLIPAILYFIGAIITMFWKMTDKEADEIREKIQKRNEEEKVK